METTRYETVTRPDKKARDFGETSRKLYLKYHIIAILSLQIILEFEITSSNVSDLPMLPSMLDGIQQQGLDLGRSVLNTDRGYDSDGNCGKAFSTGMIPNIKQRKDAVSRGKPNRRKTVGIFDGQEYKKRSLIEGIFEAEETKRHQLHCRFPRVKPAQIWQDPDNHLEPQGSQSPQMPTSLESRYQRTRRSEHGMDPIWPGQ